jgi:excisionase family DNA binding protein
MDIKQAAEQLGVSTATVRNWIRIGKIKANTHVHNTRWKYVIDEAEVQKLAPSSSTSDKTPVHVGFESEPAEVRIPTEGAAASEASLTTKVTLAPVPPDSIHVPREWIVDAIKQAVKESLLEFSETYRKYPFEQQDLSELQDALQRELASLHQEIAATKEDIQTAKDLLQFQQEQRHQSRDQHVMNQLQTIREGKHRKKKSFWWK